MLVQECYYFDAGIHLNRIMAAPIVIALSATLKTGQTRKSIKSITYPKKIRSIKFPMAPPKIKEKATM